MLVYGSLVPYYEGSDTAVAPVQEVLGGRHWRRRHLRLDAPPKVTSLLDAAIALGASRADLDGLRAKLGDEPLAGSEERFGLVPRADAEEAERTFHEKLGELQVDVAAWVPPLTDAPKVAAPHVRMRASVAQAATERMQQSREDVAPTLARGLAEG